MRNQKWGAVIAALKDAGYTGEESPCKKALSDISAFIGADGKLQTDDGVEITPEALASLIELGGADGKAPITINLGGKMEAELEDEDEDEIPVGATATVRSLRSAIQKAADSAADRAVAQALTNGTKSSRGFKASRGEGYTVPATAKKWSGKLHAFKGEDGERKAYAFGQFINWKVAGNRAAGEWLANNGIVSKALAENVNSTGGALVPDEFVPDLIRLVEDYGVARSECRVRPMTRDTLIIPRRTGGVTANFIGEGASITQSNPTYNNVQLTAKKLATLTLVSSELMEDAAIAVGDQVADEIAQSFANKEDDCAFIGDGTSTYGGMVGVEVKINDGNHAAGIFTAAAGNITWATLDLADFTGAMSKCPRYAIRNAKWYIHHEGYHQAMHRLAGTAGGVTVQQIEGGMQLMFLGFPVVPVLSMNQTAAASEIVALFGDLSMAASFGDRRQMEIATSTDRYFDTDQVAVRGIERFDFVAHDLGDGTNPGPIVALKTPAS